MSAVAELYGHDSYAWALDQAEKLRAWPVQLRPNGLDIENIAEEIEDLARSDARALHSLFVQLHVHLWKLGNHPDQSSRRHWQREVTAFRSQLMGFGRPRRGSPKLWSERFERADEAWAEARTRIHSDALIDELPSPVLPDASPYPLESQILQPDWYPEPPAA